MKFSLESNFHTFNSHLTEIAYVFQRNIMKRHITKEMVLLKIFPKWECTLEWYFPLIFLFTRFRGDAACTTHLHLFQILNKATEKKTQWVQWFEWHDAGDINQILAFNLYQADFTLSVPGENLCVLNLTVHGKRVALGRAWMDSTNRNTDESWIIWMITIWDATPATFLFENIKPLSFPEIGKL